MLPDLSRISFGRILDFGEDFPISCCRVTNYELDEGKDDLGCIRGEGCLLSEDSRISYDDVSYHTTIHLPGPDSDCKGSPRRLLRKQFLDWVNEKFTVEGGISEDAVAVDPDKNCLNVEGYAQRVDEAWKIVTDRSLATHFVSYELIVFHTLTEGFVQRDELFRLFKEPLD